jgi:DNA polymerase-1
MKASKLRESLIEQADMARLSRVLVALKEDCALPMPLESFELGAIPPEPLAAFWPARLYQPAETPDATRQP